MVVENWRAEDFLTGKWWLMLAVLVIPWIVWWFIVDKRRTYQLLTFGLFVSMIMSVVDIIGVETGLYFYPYKLIPFAPRLLEFTLGLLPVSYMLLYQYFPKWRPFTIALTVASAASAFIAEPIAAALGMYEMIRWNYLYSFIVYMAVGISVKWLTEKFPRLSAEGETETESVERRTFAQRIKPALTKPKPFTDKPGEQDD
jgi:hypothetical protein